MPAKRINPRLIKLHRAYSVEEASARLGVHKNTVRGWQRKGLEPIDTSRPVLFQGKTMRAFLEGQRKARKRPCLPGTLYCFKCRAPQAPALGMVDYTPFNPSSGNLTAMCGACGGMMHQRAALASLALKMPGIAVQITGALPRIS